MSYGLPVQWLLNLIAAQEQIHPWMPGVTWDPSSSHFSQCPKLAEPISKFALLLAALQCILRKQKMSQALIFLQPDPTYYDSASHFFFLNHFYQKLLIQEERR